jgi:hypothetical protein
MENCSIKELRIGNFVSTIIGVGEITMLDSQTKKITVRVNDVVISLAIKDIYPILLIPALFEKLGFAKKQIMTHSLGSYHWWEKSLVKVTKTLHGTFVLDNYNGPCKTFKSVHELQNIYWMLKKEELKLVSNVNSAD